MAEYLLKDALGEAPGWTVQSAGLSALDGMSASDNTVAVLRECGIDARKHRSRSLTREAVDAASMIVVMTGAHREHVQALFPDAREKVFLLKSFSARKQGDVEDPMGASLDIYREIREEIEETLPELIAFMKTLD